MDTHQTSGYLDTLTHVVGGIARAVCQRVGEEQQQQIGRTQAAAHAIMEFQPRDSVEAMIAGHCVMFHEMIVDSVRFTLGRELEGTRRTTRTNIVAMDKAFGNNLTRLAQYRAGLAEGQKPAKPVDAVAETEIADRARRHRPDAAPSRQPASTVTLETIAACQANPEAMAALKAGDPARFARAMGVDQPSDAYLAAAAAQMAGFNRQSAANRPQTYRSADNDTVQPGRQANP
jgi:hypothetical protein